ncbi:MAG: mandelate racemase/muconate lactonizing enzyme family protein [Gammaproteobacteria bacterium]|nr:mandelate racemase/muconate lactonizing enzyme family protein [Gammaproteobacteria bacterium]MBU1443861.1 mandelate racemase/muconate lactonizing enzyme family protein [Gammaproteobacteria bacterium]MBU2288783.1 mandelate racemase/muconate lactonizing enzyme family protein [Gammaproteobacteria bacterium]MBU2409219.1 mandelate racemase/muconate lactonizing enzyme family protein [Gammaproteobacteria bacterium]
MKITDVKTHVLSTPLEEPFAFSMGWVTQRSAVIVELSTDEGVTGWGEALCHGLQPPEIAAAIIETALKPTVVGQDPFDVDVLWERMYNRTRPFGQKGAVPNAISAVDIAIWDCMGRALGKPVHKLLGGAYRTEVQPYATGYYRRKAGAYPEEAIAEAKSHLAKGFKAIKLKIGFGLEEDIEYVRSVRDAVGPGPKIMVDANHAYTVGAARRLLKAIEPSHIHWFEEPISPEDIDGYKELKSLTNIYIAAGENEFTKFGFREWISRRTVDILQPDLCAAGGFTECRKISALAQAWHTPIVPHVWGAGIAQAASLQFIATLPPAPLALYPSEPMLEYDQSTHPFRQDLIYHAIGMDDRGMVQIPDGPGLGIEVNRGILERYRSA